MAVPTALRDTWGNRTMEIGEFSRKRGGASLPTRSYVVAAPDMHLDTKQRYERIGSWHLAEVPLLPPAWILASPPTATGTNADRRPEHRSPGAKTGAGAAQNAAPALGLAPKQLTFAARMPRVSGRMAAKLALVDSNELGKIHARRFICYTCLGGSPVSVVTP